MFKSIFAAGALALLTFASSALPAFAASAPPAAGAPAGQVVAAAKPAALTASEAAALQYMREEEKLAHDVYALLYSKWGLPVFDNIAASEQQHTEAVRTLLSRYGVSDPSAGKAAGVFTNPELQALYDQLVAQGTVSVAAALKTGALIEEVDILDLQKRMTQTTKADIVRVYTNLLSGSENHLRAFVSTLASQTGEVYAPQQLDQATYDRIVGAANGGRNGGNGRKP